MKKLVKILILLSTLLISILYFYTKNYWKNITSEDEMSLLINEIKKADKLPEEFYKLYEIENKKSLTNDWNQQTIRRIFSSDFKKLPSAQVATLFGLSWKNKTTREIYTFREVSLSWKIEKETTQKECLNWLASKYDFLYDNIGVKKASEYYFNKELGDLSKSELASIVYMMKNPVFYNPKRKKEALDKQVKELLNKVK